MEIKQGVCGNIFGLKRVALNASQNTNLGLPFPPSSGLIVQPMLQPRRKPGKKQPHYSYSVLLTITRELYSLGFRPKQR